MEIIKLYPEIGAGIRGVSMADVATVPGHSYEHTWKAA